MATVSRYSDKTHLLGHASADELARSASLLTRGPSPQGMRGNIPFGVAELDASSRIVTAELADTQIEAIFELDGQPISPRPFSFQPSVESEDDLYSY